MRKASGLVAEPMLDVAVSGSGFLEGGGDTVEGRENCKEEKDVVPVAAKRPKAL